MEAKMREVYGGTGSTKPGLGQDCVEICEKRPGIGVTFVTLCDVPKMSRSSSTSGLDVDHHHLLLSRQLSWTIWLEKLQNTSYA